MREIEQAYESFKTETKAWRAAHDRFAAAEDDDELCAAAEQVLMSEIAAYQAYKAANALGWTGE